MPVIKFWCLPADKMGEDDYNRLHNAVVEAVVSISELGLKDETEMTNLFVPDLMKYGLGSDIVVEIGGLLERPERTEEVRQRLAKNVGEVVHRFFPDAHVECFLASFNPSQGFWDSNS